MDARLAAGDAGEIPVAQRLRGIALILFAFLCFPMLDATAKYLTLTFASLQIVWMRYTTHAVLQLLVFRPWRAPERFWPRNLLLQSLRALALLCSTVLNFLAVRYLQLAETMSIFFLAPFLVTALAGPMLGEWAGIRRWACVVVGFAGALIIIQPGPDGFQPAMLLSLCSVTTYTFYVLLTRKLARQETIESMTVYPAVLAAIAIAPFGLAAWQAVPSAGLWVLLLSTGLYGAVGHFALVKAHEAAPASVLAPFAYTQLLWMVGLGFLIFGDVPRKATMLGAAVIVASGLYLLHRERRLGAGERL